MKTGSRDRKVLVTGGGGFLGKAIIRLLLKREENVRSFSRSFYPELESMGVEQVQGDISDKTAVIDACKEAELIFHVAAKPGIWGDYSEYYLTNVKGTQNIISACIKNKNSTLIYTSSPSVIFNGTDMEGVDESEPYSDRFLSHYSKTKAIAEQNVAAAASEGLKTIILRPHLIWGPEDNHLVPRIIANPKRLVKIGDGKNLVDTTYIENAAYAHILAADRIEENYKLSGNIYFISQDDPVFLWDMINNILKAGGLPPVERSISRKFAWRIGAFFESIYKIFNIKSEPPMTRFVADQLAAAHWFDINAAKKDLGYTPLVSTKKGLDRLSEWLLEPVIK